MRVKVFACSCRGDDEASATLNQLLTSHKIVSVEKNFVQDGQTSFWALCVTYLEQNAESRPASINCGKIAYGEIFPQDEFSMFRMAKTKGRRRARNGRSLLQGSPARFFTSAFGAHKDESTCGRPS